MRQFIVCIFYITLSAFTFADPSSGKPGSALSFVSHDIIVLQPGIPTLVPLELVSLADELQYSVQTTEGLTVKIMDKPAYVKGKTLRISLELTIHNPGRFYLHLYAQTNDVNGERMSVISRVISSGQEVDAVKSALHKPGSTSHIKLLPSTEKVRTKVNE